MQAVDTVPDLDYSGDCPFCNIHLAFPPVHPLDDPKTIARILDHGKTNPPCAVVYSGAHVMAFLDIQPLTWGHTLVIPRRHRARMGDLEAVEGAEVSFCGQILITSRKISFYVQSRLSMNHFVLYEILYGLLLKLLEGKACEQLRFFPFTVSSS